MTDCNRNSGRVKDIPDFCMFGSKKRDSRPGKEVMLARSSATIQPWAWKSSRARVMLADRAAGARHRPIHGHVAAAFHEVSHGGGTMEHSSNVPLDDLEAHPLLSVFSASFRPAPASGCSGRNCSRRSASGSAPCAKAERPIKISRRSHYKLRVL